MKCNNCGHILPSDSEFCPYCGKKVFNSNTGTNAPSPALISTNTSSKRSAFMDEKERTAILAKCALPCLILACILLVICLNMKKASSHTEAYYFIPIVLSIASGILLLIGCKPYIDAPALVDSSCLLSFMMILPFFGEKLWRDGKTEEAIYILLIVSVILYAVNLIVHLYSTIRINIIRYHCSSEYKMKCYGKIDKMNALREKGIITEEEYMKLREQITERML